MLTAMLFSEDRQNRKTQTRPSPLIKTYTESRSKEDAPWPLGRSGGACSSCSSTHYPPRFSCSSWWAHQHLHAMAGASIYNQEQAAHGAADAVVGPRVARRPLVSGMSRSELAERVLAIAAVVLLSIFLHPASSCPSKPVDAPYSETGGALNRSPRPAPLLEFPMSLDSLQSLFQDELKDIYHAEAVCRPCHAWRRPRPPLSFRAPFPITSRKPKIMSPGWSRASRTWVCRSGARFVRACGAWSRRARG